MNDAGHCGSCHASDNARKGVAPPAGFEAEVQKRESIGLAAEANEGVSAVDGKRKMNTQMSHVVFCDVHKCDVDIQSSHLKGGLFVHLHIHPDVFTFRDRSKLSHLLNRISHYAHW